MPQEFTLTVTIYPDGRVTGLVEGVKGPSCEKVSSALAALGREVEHHHTPDWDQPEPVVGLGSVLDDEIEASSGEISIGSGW
jgi:hypothetical protein